MVKQLWIDAFRESGFYWGSPAPHLLFADTEKGVGLVAGQREPFPLDHWGEAIGPLPRPQYAAGKFWTNREWLPGPGFFLAFLPAQHSTVWMHVEKTGDRLRAWIPGFDRPVLHGIHLWHGPVQPMFGPMIQPIHGIAAGYAAIPMGTSITLIGRR